MTVLAALVPASSGGAQERAIPVMVQTVPTLGGVGFSVDGEDFSSDASGLALVTVQQPGGYQVSVGDSQVDPDMRVTFVRWGDGIEELERRVSVSSFTYLQAGFQISHLVTFRFSDATGLSLQEDIDSIVLGDSLGQEVEFSGDSSRWLETNRLIPSSDGLRSRRITYRIQEVVVDGRRVVPVDERDFSPTEESWEVSLPVGSGTNGEDLQQDAEGPAGEGSGASMNVLGLVIAAGLLIAIAVGFLASRKALLQRHSRVVPRRSIPDLRKTLAPMLKKQVARVGTGTSVVKGRFPRRSTREVSEPMRVRLKDRFSRRSTREVSELVRVRLKDGRTIEGWTDPQAEKDQLAVRLVHIDRVRDQVGRSVGSTPRDAFVLQSQIATLEVLMTSNEGPILIQREEDVGSRVIDLREEDAHPE